MKDNKINPIGLKGYEITDRMKELMGQTIIKENTTSVVELTKIGPDGKAYAIVRENHQYFIKTTDKTTSLIAEDFKYIGGLQNKTSEAHTSYAKAIKMLNLKFNSLAESFDNSHNINVFKNDNLIIENGSNFYADMPKGGGFTGEGNLEGNTPLYGEEEDIVEEECDVELTEAEEAINSMLEEEEEEDEKSINESKISLMKTLGNVDALIDSYNILKKKV